MSTQITLQTTDGRIIKGINFSVDSTTLPKNVNALAASMQGGMTYGVYHVYTPSGWQYIPASQIAKVISVSQGAPT
jgi:hypothetical protein